MLTDKVPTLLFIAFLSRVKSNYRIMNDKKQCTTPQVDVLKLLNGQECCPTVYELTIVVSLLRNMTPVADEAFPKASEPNVAGCGDRPHNLQPNPTVKILY